MSPETDFVPVALDPTINLENFKAYVSGLPTTTQKGEHFEIFCFYLLSLCPIYKYRYKQLWLYKDFPNKRKEKLHLSKTDKGTDIVLKLKDEYCTDHKYISVQCKFVSDERAYTQKELATFCDDATILKEGLLISTQNTRTDFHGADQLENRTICQIILPDLLKLESCKPEWIQMILQQTFLHINGSKTNVENGVENVRYNMAEMEERAYQKECVSAGLAYFKYNNKGILHAAGGTGKTFMAISLFNALMREKNVYNKKLMIVVPSLFLIEQTMKYFVQSNDSDNNFIINFCSIAESNLNGIKFTTSEKDLNIYIDRFNELSEQICTNEPNIDQNNEVKGKNLVVIVTYASVKKCMDVFKEANYHFDAIIFDEAHTLVHENKNLSNWFFDQHDTLPCDKQIFVSATPKYIDCADNDKGKKKIVSTSNEAQFGKVFFKYSMRQAIDAGYLADYRVYVPVSSTISIKHVTLYLAAEHNLSEDKEPKKEHKEPENQESEGKEKDESEGDKGKEPAYEENEKDKDGDKDGDNDNGKPEVISVYWRLMLAAYTIQDAFYRGKKKCMAICNTVKDMRKLAEIVILIHKIDGEEIFSAQIDGNMKTRERNRLIKEFEETEKPALLISVRTLTTGSDIPCVDSICITSPIHSESLIIQIICRGIRLYEKKVLDILIPILQEESSFDSMRDIIAALGKEDETFIEAVNIGGNNKLKMKELKLNREIGYRTWAQKSEKVDIDEVELFKIKENLSQWRMEMFDTEEDRTIRSLEKTKKVIEIIESSGKMIRSRDKEWGNYVSSLKYLYIGTIQNKQGDYRQFSLRRIGEYYVLRNCKIWTNWYENERKEKTKLTNEEFLEKTKRMIEYIETRGKMINKRHKEWGTYFCTLKKLYTNIIINNKKDKYNLSRLPEVTLLKNCKIWTNWYENRVTRENLTIEGYLEKTKRLIELIEKQGQMFSSNDRGKWGLYSAILKKLYKNTINDNKPKFSAERSPEMGALQNCKIWTTWYETYSNAEIQEILTTEGYFEKTQKIIEVIEEEKTIPTSNKEWGRSHKDWARYINNLKQFYIHTITGTKGKFTSTRMREFELLKNCKIWTEWYKSYEIRMKKMNDKSTSPKNDLSNSDSEVEAEVDSFTN